MPLTDKYVNPFTDFGFKKLFGSEPNKELLIDFLNQLLPQKHQITELTYARNEHQGLSEQDRKAIFDVYCVSQNGDRFIVEVQKAKQNFFKDRSVFYSTFPIQEQALKGEWDFKLAAVYTVGILDFVFAEDQAEKRVMHVVQLKDQQCRVFYEKLTFIYLEMPHFAKKVEELETHFDKWLYVFKHLPYLTSMPLRIQDKIFQKLFQAAEIANFTPAEQQEYENSLKYYRDLKNVTDTAYEEGKLEGLQEGLEKGLQEGLEKGLQEGLEKGLQEGLEKGKLAEKESMARTALAKGLSITMVAELTGLTETHIQSLL